MFSPPVSLKTQSAQRDILLSFLLRGQKRKDLHRDVSRATKCQHKNMVLSKSDPLPLGVLSFVFLPLKGKQIKDQLCVLCASAVKRLTSQLV